MPLYQVDVDGQTVEFDSPVDLTPEQLEAEVSGFRSQLASPAAPEEAPGYLSQLGTSLYQGGRQALGGARTAFNALTGDTADMAAGLQQQAEAQRALQEAQTPEDVAFLEDLNKQAEELKQARGFLPTLSEAIDLPMAALRQPGAALKTAVQSLPNALISTPITLGAGLVGTAAGGLVGLPTTGPGAVATGIAGGIAAGTAANTALEAGSEIYQRFVERIGDPAGMTREQIAAALDQNPDIASEGLTTGLTRGAVIGTIETLGLKGAGALLAAPERAAIQATRQVLTRSGVDLADDVAVRAAMATPEMAKATKAAADAARAGFNVPARAVGAGAVEIGASGVGEALAQQAVGQETDYADVFLEMLGEGVAAAPSVLAARGVELAGTGIQAVRERVSEQVADNAKADARLDIDDLINNAGENAATQVNQAVDDAAKVVPAPVAPAPALVSEPTPITPVESLPAVEAEAPAAVETQTQPEPQPRDEIQIAEAGGLPPVESQPSIQAPAVEAPEGVALGGGQGQEGQVTPEPVQPMEVAPAVSELPAPQAEVVSPEGVTPPQPLPPTGGVPTESLPAGQPTSGDVGTALRAVATNTATPEQVASLEAQGLARTVQGQPVITDAGLARMPEAERPRLTEAERVAEIQQQTQNETQTQGMAPGQVRGAAIARPTGAVAPTDVQLRRELDLGLRTFLSAGVPTPQQTERLGISPDGGGATIPWPTTRGASGAALAAGVAAGPDGFVQASFQNLRDLAQTFGATIEVGSAEGSPLSVSSQSDGSLILRIDPSGLANAVSIANAGDAAGAMRTVSTALYEEFVHLADLAAQREAWVQSGIPDFNDFLAGQVAQPPAPTNTPPANVQPSIRPLQGDQQRNETGARKRRGKAQVPASLRDRDGPPLPNIKVSANDGARAREIEDKQVPGAKDTWIGTVAEYLAEFPDQTDVNDRRVEAFYDAATDRAVILIDRVVARDGDAIRAARNGTSAAVEAVRRLIRHESFVHRGWRALPQNLKTEFLAIAESLVPEEEINAIVAKGYSRYANWSTDPAVRALVVEEWLAQRLETLEKLPATDGGPLSRMIDWAKRVWQWLNGNDAVEPTRAELVDVMRQMIRALEIGEKSREVAEPIRPSFIGEKAQMSQFMRDSLETARSMAAAGKSSEEIRAVTGWFPGLYDGKMRWELPDNEAAFVDADTFDNAAVATYGGQVFNRLPIQTIVDRIKSGNYVKLSDVFNHPKLFAAYPDAANIPFFPIGGNVVQGSHRIVDGNSVITATVLLDESGQISEESTSVLLHELQHYIQNREGFAKGASPDSLLTKADLQDAIKFRDAYRGLQKYRKQIADLVDVMAREKAKTGFLGFGGPNQRAIKSVEDQIKGVQDSVNAVWEAQGKSLNLDRDSTRAALLSAINKVEDELGASWVLQNRNEGLNRIYKRVAGEIEARDVQARRTMTPEQRRATAPYSSENIAPEDAIVIFDGREQGVMASLTDTDAAYMDALQGDNGSDNLQVKIKAAPQSAREQTVNDWITRNPRSAATAQRMVDEATRAAISPFSVKLEGKGTSSNQWRVSLGRRSVGVFRDPENGYWFFSDFMDTGAPSPIATSKADAIQRAIERLEDEVGGAVPSTEVIFNDWRKGKMITLPGYYIRFGDLPAGGRSVVGNQPGVFEKGVSVLKAWKSPEGVYVISSATSETGASDMVSGMEDRPVYIAYGEDTGEVGSDGEPLLKNVFLTEQLFNNRIVVDDPSYIDQPITNNTTDFKNWEMLSTAPDPLAAADPVTYDDAGNVIPLSQRFQPESPDIRFSIADTDAEYRKIMAKYDDWKSTDVLAPKPGEKNPRPYSPIVRDLLIRKDSGEDIPESVISRAIDEHFQSKKIDPNNLNLPSQEKVLETINSQQRAEHEKTIQMGTPEPGTPITARQDVPSHKKGVGVTTTQIFKNGKQAGTLYFPSVRYTDPVFSTTRGSEKIARGIAKQERDKTPAIKIDGKWSGDQSIPADLENWTQVGFNPDRHSYYYEKGTNKQVFSGDEAFQVGNTVFVKNPNFEPPAGFQPSEFRFSLTDPTASNIIQDANQTTTEQQPTRSRPLSPETAPGRATEVLPTGEEIVERTQIDKTSMPRLEALAIKFVDSLGPVDTWPNKILNTAWWKANGGNMRDDFGQMVMAEALYRTGIGALQGNPTLVEVNDLISREYQTGATQAAKALASRSYITSSERYGPMFAVQGMIDQRRRQQETVIDANVDVAAGVDAVNNADAQAQTDASAELDEELRLKDAIYELGLAARTPEIQTRIRRINDNVFRLGVLAQIREQLLSRVQASFVGLSRAAVEQQYASLSVEQIDAEIARLEREVADDVAAVEGERQRVRAAPKPKGAAADPITQARKIIDRLEADPKTKKTPKANPVRDLYREHLKNPMAEDEFMTRMAGIGVPAAEAQKLYDLAAVKIAATEAVKAQREAESQEDSPAVAFAKRTIDDVASRLADPALPQEERQRKVLAIRELYKEHVRDGLPFDVFISRAEAAGVEGAMASTLHGVGMMEREARETTRGYNEAQAGQRFAEKTINDAATLYADPALPQPVRNKRRVAAQELYNKHVKKAMDQAEFLEAARKAGVNEATAMVLFNVGNMTREAREAQAYGRRLIERRERLLDAEGSALENLINKLRGKITGDLSWREMFDRPLETQRQWRRDLFAALRNNPALAGLTPQEIGDLVVEIDKVWEAKRKKNFEAQLKRMNLPGAKGNSKDKIVKSAPKLLRYINAGFFNDDAFRNAISEEFGIPALNEETVKQVVDLMQRAQADGITEVERKGLMIEAIRLMQRDLKAELGDILSNYWVTSVLSGFATQFDMAFSALNGMRVMAQSMADLAIRKREFKLAGRAGMAYLRALGNVILEAARYFYTGDPKLLDNYQYTLNTYLTEGSAAANPFDYFERIIKDPNRPSWAKIMPYFYAGMQRAMTAFDHINSTATTQGMLEMAMFYNRELYDGARMPSKEDVAAARAKAVEMAGGDKTWGQKREVSSYTRQILNELLNKKYPGLLDEARDIGKVVSYTNDPTGIGGIVYHTLLGVTNKYINEAGKYRDEVRAQQEAASRTKRFMANLNYIAAANARNLTGLRFVRFVGNRLNEILSFTPGLGLLRLQEKGMTPTMRAMIIQNQTVGLSLSVLAGVTILRALTDEEDDEKRGFRISGSWSSLPPDKKNQLRASGRSPYAIELWDGKKWTSFNYNAWPVASIIATAGNLNDQRLFNPEKWEEKDLEDKLLSAAWAGAFSFKDLSALSGFMDMIGKSAYSTDPVEGATQWISKFSSNYVGGFIPRMLKDIDLIMDSETRKARDFGAYFAKELPFYRRTEAAGEKLYNIFGEPVKLNRMPWRRAVTATREEPEYETLAELNRRGIFLGAANPSNRTVGNGANRRELTDAEAEKYMVETGNLYRDFIKQQGQSLLQLDRAQAEEVISKTTERLRAAALRMSIGATK